jgi:hypothetical protein
MCNSLKGKSASRPDTCVVHLFEGQVTEPAWEAKCLLLPQIGKGQL